jgi:hypothetical protein
MRCPSCGSDTPDGGSSVLTVAPLTEQPPAPPSSSCQSPLSSIPGHLAEKILASKAALERKQVTVLFADLKGAMKLLAGSDPEEVWELLYPVLERMTDAMPRDAWKESHV